MSRIAEACEDAVKNEPGGSQAVMKFIEPYLQNKTFAQEAVKVEELRKAALEIASVEEVKGSPAGEKLMEDNEFLAKALEKRGLSKDQIQQLLGGSGVTPPPSDSTK